jgi:hypothetical protein
VKILMSLMVLAAPLSFMLIAWSNHGISYL